MDTQVPFEHLANSLKPAARKKLLNAIAISVRGSTAADIKSNTDPDGRSYDPRIPQPRQTKKLRKKGKMFRKLGLRKSMQIKTTQNKTTIEFQPKNKRIANVHNFGLMSTVNKKGLRVKYIERQLMGFNSKKNQDIENRLVEHLASI